jgi:cell division protein FtsZ
VDPIKQPTPALYTPPPLQGHLNSFLPKIVVVGVGGAGGNAVNNMIAQGLQGVDFVVCNTDAQHLATTLTDKRVQLGIGTTGGLGCGAQPSMGQQAAEESAEEILDAIGDANMVFITAGMGGGTGTGAAPVIAQLSLAENMLTVAVVTKPFRFEGNHRMVLAEEGMLELQESVDTMIVVPNQNLLSLASPDTSLMDAFRMADDVLLAGVKSVTDLMVCPGLINLDFADVETVMQGMGNSMMGTGEAGGEARAVRAAEEALSNPLLGNLSVSSAKGMLVNITGGEDMTLFEVDEAAQRITSEVDDENANIIFGSTFDASLEGKLRVSVVATGIDVGE